MYYEQEGIKYLCEPIQVHVSNLSKEKKKKIRQADQHNIFDGKVDSTEKVFRSRAFMIRYCEEEVEINDIGHFRAEVEVEQDYLNTEFFLEVGLFFSDLNEIGGAEKWQEKAKDIESLSVFKNASKAKFKL